ncbi:MAG: SPOR domain-containing protein [Rickettsiales bacterium]|nr:SPOR domain-containing protein [Rickettsiales bacterium]
MDKKPMSLDEEQKSGSILLPLFAFVALGLFLTLCWYAYSYYINSQKSDGVYYIKADKSAFKVKPEDQGGMEISNQDKQIFNAMKGASENIDESLNVVETGGEDIVKINLPDENNKKTEDGGLVSAVESEAKKIESNLDEKAKEKLEIVQKENEKLIKEAEKIIDVQKEIKLIDQQSAPKESIGDSMEKDLKAEVSAEKKVESVSKTQDKNTGVNKTTIALKSSNKEVVGGKGFYVQISSHKSVADLEAGWGRFLKKFPNGNDGKGKNISEAIVNGSKYYRLSFGPYKDKPSAVSKCVSLKAKGQDCLIQVY